MKAAYSRLFGVSIIISLLLVAAGMFIGLPLKYAMAGAPEISIKGNGVVIDNGDFTPSLLDHTDFGDADFAGGAVVRAFRINNTGDADLNLTDASPYVTIEGDTDGNFYVSTLPAPLIPAGEWRDFYITFDPNDIGLCSANISIANDDSDESPYDINISAIGMILPAGSNLPQDDTIYINGDQANINTGANGQIQNPYIITSGDGGLKIYIPRNTIALDGNGNPLHRITINMIYNPPPPPPPPSGLNIIWPAFSLSPPGTTFSQPVTITLHYTHDCIPPGVAEGDLKIGYYNELTGEWKVLDCTIDTVNNTITVVTSGFSYYFIAYGTSPAVFSVSNLVIILAESEPGATVNISAAVANTGIASGDYTLNLKVNGTVIDSKAVTLAAGATETVTFTLNNQPAGIYNVNINGLYGSYAINAPAEVIQPSTPAVIAPSQPDNPVVAPTSSAPLTAPLVPTQPVSMWFIVIIAAAGLVLVFLIWRLTRRAR
jgi:hypothetical protein